jgi:small subunit ribosomal protein S4
MSTARYGSSSWLEFDEPSMTGVFLNRPEREDIPENIKEQLIVELYSK